MSQKKSPMTAPGSDEKAKGDKSADEHGQNGLAKSADPSSNASDSPDARNLILDIDEGPQPGPVDEIQQALFEAAQSYLQTDVDLSALAAPTLEPRRAKPKPDDIEDAIKQALQEAKAADFDFDALPSPNVTAKKVITFDKPIPPQPKTLTPPPPQPHPRPSTPPEQDFEPEPASPAEPPPKPQPEPEPEISLPDPVSSVSDFWFLLILFTTFRLFTLFLLRPGGFIRDWSDFDTYFGIASLSDFSLYPFLDFWLEWPPLVPWLSVGAYRLSLLLPPWSDDPRLWFIILLGFMFVLFEVGNFVMIYRLAKKLFQTPATVTRVLWFYVGLFTPVYAMLGFFDGVALFFLLLALDLILSDRRMMSAVTIGVGFMVKIVPILMLPVALRRLWYQYRHNNREAGVEAGIYGVVLALTVLVLLAPFIITPALDGNPQWWSVAFRSMLGRSSWETVWAVGEGYYGFGQVGGDRLDPNVTQADFAIHAGWPGAIWFLITLAFVGGYAYLFTRPANYKQPCNLVAFGGLTVITFLLYSKGYSPQFLVYLLPFIILLMPTGRGLAYALILTGLNILEQPIYFVMLPDAHWLLTFVVVARFATLILLGLEFALIIWPVAERSPRLTQWHARSPLVLGGLAALALIILTPLSIRAYTHHQLDNTDLGTFTGFMEERAEGERVILSSQDTYRQIYPYLADTLDLKLASFDPNLTERTVAASRAPKPADLLQGLNRVWVLPTGPNRDALHNIAANRGDVLATYNFGDIGEVSLYTFEPNPIPLIAPARFTGGVELLEHHTDIADDTVTLTLYWRALDPQTQKLTVFTQLLDSNGELIAGHDSIPRDGAAPVPDWPVGEVQADTHRIALPFNLRPGEYSLVVGMYNRFNERIAAIAPDGTAYPNRAVPLGMIELR
ncbi:MAG: hypothetical protein KDJ52_13985 [Anaerolineae bacterium]|nr:hypothetical protein [Anaerolineae bacterium]